MLVETSINVVLSIFFFTFNKANILFIKKRLIWWSYLLVKFLSTTKRIQIISLKKFTIVALDLGKKAFMVFIAYLRAKIFIYPARKTKVALLIVEKVIILVEYSDFEDIFSKKLALKLSKRFDINKHSINLELSKQPPYGTIHSLEPVEFKILKTYIKTNWLTNLFDHLNSLLEHPSYLSGSQTAVSTYVLII